MSAPKPFRTRLEAALRKVALQRLTGVREADAEVPESVKGALAIYDRHEARCRENDPPTGLAKTEAERRELQQRRGLPETGYTDAEVADWAEVFLDLYLARVEAKLAG